MTIARPPANTHHVQDFLHMVNLEVCALAHPHVQVRMGASAFAIYGGRNCAGLYWPVELDPELPASRVAIFYDGAQVRTLALKPSP